MKKASTHPLRVLGLALLASCSAYLQEPHDPPQEPNDPPPVQMGRWDSTGSMASPRAGHTATLLTDGKVLVTGGVNTSVFLSTAEVYDPALGSWSATGSMASPRYHSTATLLTDGKVLVTGGISTNGCLATAEVYDPATGAWSATGSIASPRYSHTATLLPDGKVLVAGGITCGSGSAPGSVATVEVYDQASGTWNAVQSLAVPLFAHTATLFSNGKVLVEGGADAKAVGGRGPGMVITIHAQSEVYDPASDTWSIIADSLVPHYQHTATLLSNGKVLVAGGLNDIGRFNTAAKVYDPASGTWSIVSSMASGANMHTATLVPDGTVLFVGVSSTDAEVYDPASDTWTATGFMVSPRYEHTATLLPNGKVLVAGGRQTGIGTFATSELYTP